jgi:hypothetical protein
MFSANFTLSDTDRIFAWARTDRKRKGRSQRGVWGQEKKKRMIWSRRTKEKNEKMEEEEKGKKERRVAKETEEK